MHFNPELGSLTKCRISNLLYAPGILCQGSRREQGRSLGWKVWALCFSSCMLPPVRPTRLGLTRNHPAFDGLLLCQPYQELTFATTDDGRADVVLPYARVLLFCSYFPSFCPRSPVLTRTSGRLSSERLRQSVPVWHCLGRRYLIWSHPTRSSRVFHTTRGLRKSSYVTFYRDD